jgi:hypothetical protein
MGHPAVSAVAVTAAQVHQAVCLGGKVLIPVFAVGRAQELLLLLDEFWERTGLQVRHGTAATAHNRQYLLGTCRFQVLDCNSIMWPNAAMLASHIHSATQAGSGRLLWLLYKAAQTRHSSLHGGAI